VVPDEPTAEQIERGSYMSDAPNIYRAQIVASPFRVRHAGKIEVRLIEGGRGKPIPDDNPYG
jgi:hypothetical protein